MEKFKFPFLPDAPGVASQSYILALSHRGSLPSVLTAHMFTL